MKKSASLRFALLCTVLACTPSFTQNAAAQAAPPVGAAATETTRRFDFGGASVEASFAAVGADTLFTPERGYGWTNTNGLLMRDRSAPDATRRDFVFGKSAATFRVANLKPGRYLLTVVCGDIESSNHETRLKIPGSAPLPLLNPAQFEFTTLTFTVDIEKEAFEITFDSPSANWIVNALTLEPTTKTVAPTIARQKMARTDTKNSWAAVATWPDPTKELLAQFRGPKQAVPLPFKPSGLTRDEYLKIIASGVDFWKGQQNADGAIIDPYRKIEWQYSTPAYAHAAAALVAWANRKDLIESAAKALDWSARTLSERKAATAHEDFFAPMLAHAIPLLKPFVPAERAARWEADIRRFDPLRTYRAGPGGGNWNVVAAAGEALFGQMGLRDAGDKFVEMSLAAQGRHFSSPHGLYPEGPMAYDHFPRLWVADMIAHGYAGPYHAELTEVLRRSAITSLFMQSPHGELPAGGRSAHHQWNEAQQCVTYEIYAARALKEGDAQLAGIYRRAAHLALSSMQRWVRPSGEMQIVKNWVDPAKSHGFEGYSAHSQYNLLPLSMLAIAYHHAETTGPVAEQPAPADYGGYVLQIAELHKIFANAGGTYIEIDTAADHRFDATGLIRVHIKGVPPQIGPSDSIVKSPAYRVPAGPKTAHTGVGAAWQSADGAWHRLGELNSATITKTTLANVQNAPQRVSFDVIYEGKLFGITRLTEHYVLTPGQVQLTTTLDGYSGPLRYMWPVLADDGRTPSTITVDNNTVAVSQGNAAAQTFTAIGASSVRVENERYPNHNGWARIAVAEYPSATPITLQIVAREAP